MQRFASAITASSLLLMLAFAGVWVLSYWCQVALIVGPRGHRSECGTVRGGVTFIHFGAWARDKPFVILYGKQFPKHRFNARQPYGVGFFQESYHHAFGFDCGYGSYA